MAAVSSRCLVHVRVWLVGLSLAGSAAFGQFPGAEPVPQELATGFDSITVEDARSRLGVLTSKEFGGRGSGQEGFLEAARWYAGELEKAGFQPAGTDGSWFQNVPLVKVSVAEASGLTVNGAKVPVKFGLSSFVGEATASGNVVFLNLVDTQADLGDSAQFDGKVVVLKSSGRSRFRRAAMPQSLRKAKPACVIRVTSGPLLQDRVGRQASIPTSAPALSVSEADANQIAAACELAKDYFTKTPEANSVIATTAQAECAVSVLRETVDVPNVIGWFPGSDPELRHEHVGLGAHLDHLGTRGGVMYPGADDNGSGSTALLQIARAIQANPVKPKRSVLLIVFCGEELGLLGSRYYVEHPTRPLEDMVCMLNIDMIGRNEEKANEPAEENIDTIHLVGSKRISTELHDLTLEMNKYVGFRFEYDEEGVYTRSDHANFARKGIPITFIFGGFNPHYHQPSDTMEGINFNKIVSGAKLNYLCCMKAAEHGHFKKDVKQ